MYTAKHTGRRAPSRVVAATAAAATVSFGTLAAATTANAASTVTVSTESQLTSAISSATAGTTILLNAGTYTGQLNISRSGTSSSPITMKPSGNGTVYLTANLSLPSCSATSPDKNRTIKFTGGASYWTISGLNIKGGIYMAGQNVNKASSWFSKLVSAKNWSARRAVPGQSTNDASAEKNAMSYIGSQTGYTLKPDDGVQLIGNTITQKGIHATLTRYGTMSDNTISNIACGVGAGIWLGMFSSGWDINHNTVSTIADSTGHWMHEGIRADNGSSYNSITYNTVKTLTGDGRAFTTDQDASFNTFSHNTATDVAIGYNDEMSGWGNTWADNAVSSYRTTGYAFRVMDSTLTAPSKNSSTYDASVRCNTASGSGDDLDMGASSGSSVTGNAFDSIHLSDHLKSYWVAQGNTYNGQKVVPPASPSAAAVSSC